jgi:hypothetical protein
MQDFGEIVNNRVLLFAVMASFLAQASKLLVELWRDRKFNWQVLFETGGMPSSHSAFVTALAAGVGQTAGWESTEFAIATVLAIVVMYDAAGVRQAAGKHARMLNRMVDELFHEDHPFGEVHLKELLGHTPFQVIAGSIFGACVSWVASPAY